MPHPSCCCRSEPTGRPAVDDRRASLIAQWTIAIHLVALVMMVAFVAFLLFSQETPQDDSDRSAAARRSVLFFVSIGLVLQVLLYTFLVAAEWLATWGRSRWELVSLISTSTSVALVPWLGPGSVSCLFGWEQAAVAGEQDVVGLLAVVILGLAHATCVPVAHCWSWVVPMSSWCSFAALVGVCGTPAPLMLLWKILALLLMMLVSVGGAWSREQLLREVQTHVSECRGDEAGDEKTCEADALERAIGIETQGSKAEEDEEDEDDKAWPDCTAILPGNVVETVRELEGMSSIAEAEMQEAINSHQHVGGEEADVVEVDLMTKAGHLQKPSMPEHNRSLPMNIAGAGNGMNRLPWTSVDSRLSFTLTQSELDTFPINATVSTQTEATMAPENEFDGLLRSMGMQAPTAKSEPGSSPDLAPLISSLCVEVEKATAGTQTERGGTGTSDAAVNTSIQWSEYGFKCGDCARPPKLPGLPSPNRRRRKRRQRDSSAGDNDDATTATASTDAVDTEYAGDDFDGFWVIHDYMANDVAEWLTCLNISGSHVVLGDGSKERIVMYQGQAMLDRGVLELSGGQLRRVGKSGRLAVFNRGDEVIGIEEGAQGLQQIGASDDDDDDGVESLVSFVMS